MLSRFKYKLSLLFLLALSLPTSAWAQYYMNGQDPFRIRWQKIETEHFRVIFSDKIPETGQFAAKFLEEAHQTAGLTLGHEARKIPVIIHAENVLSNGEVVWAPKRMNLYILQPQTGNMQSNELTLLLHELRHVEQIDKLNQSSTRFFFFLLGEQAIGAILGWHIPLWFFEGDAVSYETGATQSGRGRMPDFAAKLQAQVEHRGIFSYPKAQFGSYKEFVPNHYELGYQLVNYGRQQYGVHLWDSTLLEIARFPIHPNAFSKGLKKYSGLPERKFYQKGMEAFQHAATDTSAPAKSPRPADYLNYYAPQTFGKQIISYRTSYNSIPQLVLTDSTGKDQSLLRTGALLDETFSYNDSLILWNELKRTRWENENWSNIVCYDLRSQQKHYLTRKARAFYSRLSADNSLVVSTEVNDSLQWRITLRETSSGQIIESFPFRDGQVLQANLSPDAQEIVFLYLNPRGKSLGILHRESGKIDWLLQDQLVDMNFPRHLGNKILLQAVYQDRTNLLLYRLDSQQWQVLTAAPYATGEGELLGNKLLYSTYTYRGFQSQTLQIDTLQAGNCSGPQAFQSPYSDELKHTENLVSPTLSRKDYPIQKYSRLKHLVNLHSWAPVSVDIQNYAIGPGVSLFSQNALSTSTLSAGYQYIRSEAAHLYFVETAYHGFRPVLSARLEQKTWHDTVMYEEESYQLQYTQTTVDLGMERTFNLDRGAWYRRLIPSLDYGYVYYGVENELSGNRNAFESHNFYYSLYFSQTLYMSHRNLQPQWGQVLQLQYMHSPFHPDHYGQLGAAQLTLYLPGLLRNQGLKLYGGFQIKERGQSYFSDRLTLPYGQTTVKNKQIQTAQAYYNFPLFYPDWNLWEYVYLLRFRAKLFYQYANFRLEDNSNLQKSSVGLDLSADFHAFRFTLPLAAGLRYAYRIEDQSPYFEILFSINY